MNYKKNQTFSFLLISVIARSVWTQANEIDDVRDVSSSLNQFTLKFLAETANQAGDSLNLALSPYTVWSLLTVIAEGARGETAQQLQDVLEIPLLHNLFRRDYKSLAKYLLQPSDGIDLDISSAIFTPKEQKLNKTYEALTKYFYGVDIIPTDFKNLVQALNSVNSYFATATKNKVQNFVKIDDVINAVILMATNLFFKGQWKSPFNKTSTFQDTFFDERGNANGKVIMMYQIGSFPYTILPELNSRAIELPYYGNGDRFSMIVVLPRINKSLNSVLNRMATFPFNYVLNTLANAGQQFSEEEVQVYLPKFVINSDLNLKAVLDDMGIKDAFHSVKADLLGIFPHNLYITGVIQQARIEVDEEGTVASAATGASFQQKSSPIKFYANKGFAYFIIDKSTRGIIFAGKFSNPNSM